MTRRSATRVAALAGVLLALVSTAASADEVRTATFGSITYSSLTRSFLFGGDDFSVTEVRKRLQKLPRNIDSKGANHVAKRLDALGMGMAIPKGPIPTSANAGKGARRAMLRGR